MQLSITACSHLLMAERVESDKCAYSYGMIIFQKRQNAQISGLISDYTSSKIFVRWKCSGIACPFIP